MKQLALFEKGKKLLSFKDACEWASRYLNRRVTISNISYLVQYGRLKKYGDNGKPMVDIDELQNYYDRVYKKEIEWRKILGEDLNWRLSFVEYRESERTKHVHRLHPYKGKFIPQLVEYFLDDHTDEYKTTTFFKKGDVVLDPFCGSGTTLVQANELGIHAIGIDVSAFNAMMSNIKVGRHNIAALHKTLQYLTAELMAFREGKNNFIFEEHLLERLAEFNKKNFPSPDYKRRVRQGILNEKEYAKEKEQEFLPEYWELVQKYNIKVTQDKQDSFLDTWFLAPVREEIDFMFEKISRIDVQDIRDIAAIILSRTARSCRATTHADLATLKEPVIAPYYCKKHGKICKPIFSIMGWWRRYSQDTLKRLSLFNKLRTDTVQIALTGDSREIDIAKELEKTSPFLAEQVKRSGVSGIFSSPPYVGLIDYHEQHAYAYEILGFERNDHAEIGPLYKGQGKDARKMYVGGIAAVLRNCKHILKKDYNVFLVANDKYNLYPEIAKLAGMRIINTYKRPVLNRVEKDRSAYAEIIFHLKEPVSEFSEETADIEILSEIDLYFAKVI